MELPARLMTVPTGACFLAPVQDASAASIMGCVTGSFRLPLSDTTPAMSVTILWCNINATCKPQGVELALVDCRSAKCLTRVWLCTSQPGVNNLSMMHSAIVMLMRPGRFSATVPRMHCVKVLMTVRSLDVPIGSPAHLGPLNGLAKGR